jgi:glycine/D-amino acid oxidase-like deaminating enzyme
MTKDKRILIRNTAETSNTFIMKNSELKKRTLIQKIGINKRFPELPKNIIESSWSGIVCRSGNSSQIFDKIDDKIYAAGCYNGSGIGVGTLFGEQIALMASNEDTDEIRIIKRRKKPNLLPPEPFLNIGIKSRLIYERFKAKSDI